MTRIDACDCCGARGVPLETNEDWSLRRCKGGGCAPAIEKSLDRAAMARTAYDWRGRAVLPVSK